MNPIPWLRPKTKVSSSKPGASQKNSRAPNSASSTHEARFTHAKSGPGDGRRRASAGRASVIARS